MTYTDEEYQVSKARKGYEVESYRVTYENEQPIARELLYTDTYAAKAARIYVGIRKESDGFSGEEAASLREAPPPQTPSPEERLAFGGGTLLHGGSSACELGRSFEVERGHGG